MFALPNSHVERPRARDRAAGCDASETKSAPFSNAIVDTTDAAAIGRNHHNASHGMAQFESRYREAQELARRTVEQEHKALVRKARKRTTPLFETEEDRRRREHTAKIRRGISPKSTPMSATW